MMFDYSDTLNLPLIWAGLVALAVFIYAALDGFDLGCGLLFPFAPSDDARSRIMNSIAPFWDGNETWLILGGGGLLAAFPVAYGVILSGLYIPVIIMLFGLIFRGVAFELRFKSNSSLFVWDLAFFIGSFLAAFMQGVMLATIVQGMPVENRVFAGGGFDWLTPFSLLGGLAVVAGYALHGSTWLIMKTHGDLQKWAALAAEYAALGLAVALVALSIVTPFLDTEGTRRLYQFPNMLFLAPLPVITVVMFFWMRNTLKVIQKRAIRREYLPFILSFMVFVLGFVGLIFTVFPYIIPYEMTFEQAAATGPSLSIMLIGAGVMLPIILAYTAFGYYVFRGKSDAEPMY